ncbi:3748_t:CDS:2 [Funneliformis mosseae]|uniref:3748_t:CDS:1 n=1 Tax=Funneliformis mosseae TaxID=27381 RepID=A0A9N9AE18_FUNMO|nr:3748_t:CDS:2 [Funneliformis mosseae]
MLKNRKCSYCDELIEKQCKECDSPYRISESWTSGDVRIDNFIKDAMYKARNGGRWLEWISFDRFTNIELYEDGFDKVYLALWLDGRDNYLEQNGSLKNEPQPVKVFLKQFNLSADCLNEIKNHWEFFNTVVALSSKFYGISKTSGNSRIYNGHSLWKSKTFAPEFGKGTPEIYKDFVNKCINVNPDRRPTSPGLYKQLKFWYRCIIGDCAESDKYGEMVKSAFDNADNYNDEDVEEDAG